MKPTPQRESGFALLLVFAMAASIAIMMYMQLPRQAFERQRDKEQLLIDRGEQYQRAIKLYFRKFKQYPQSLDALNETNGIHFLRHQFKDPMTGKSEWRLIHVGPGGVFTDSKVIAPPGQGQDKEEKKEANTFITEGPAVGSTATQQQGTPTASYRRERGGAASGMPNPGQPNPGQPNPGQPYPGQPYPGQPYPAGQTYPGVQPYQPYPGAPPVPNTLQPGTAGVPVIPGMGVSGQVGQMPGVVAGQMVGQMPGVVAGQQPSGTTPQPYPYPYPVQQPGMPYTGPYPPGVPGVPGQPYMPGQFPTGQYPVQGVPGSSGPFQPVPYTYPPQPANSQQGGVSSPYYSVQPGVGGAPAGTMSPFPQPGTGPATNPTTTPFGAGQSNPATEMIKRLLTTPRPGGLAGLQQGQGLQTITGGIAGIASKLEEESIKVYNDREEYDEWEFIYDPQKDTTQAQAMGITGATPSGTGSKTTLTADPSSTSNPTSPASQDTGGRPRFDTRR